MDIGVKIDKPHIRIMEDASRIILEDSEMCTYTLYEIEETVMHPKPKVADKYAEKPYTFDALTGVMRIYRLVGVCEDTDEALEKLLGEATQV